MKERGSSGAIRVAGHELVRGRLKHIGDCECWALITGAGARAEASEVEAGAEDAEGESGLDWSMMEDR